MGRAYAHCEVLPEQNEEERAIIAEAVEAAGFRNPDVIYKDGAHVSGWWLAYPYMRHNGAKIIHRHLLDQYLGPTVERAIRGALYLESWNTWKQERYG